ncbi:hypothetical protein HPB49_020087 [Dermacentor silvarum]|uniref:Uncharacterized protein n=1 Tax=Dermacentor silvarum TaxID=543639 RepID=A0ACB8D7P3_DERSI|nr:hypothetical protein HPB49_020087 [Dermacentor silvarum]
MTQLISSSDVPQPDETDVGNGHSDCTVYESADNDKQPAGAVSEDDSMPPERRTGPDKVVAVAMGTVADRSDDDQLGRSSEMPLTTPDHGGEGYSHGGIHGYGSGTEPPGATFCPTDADSRTSERTGHKAGTAASNNAEHVSQPVQARTHSLSDKYLPTQNSNVDNIDSSMTDARRDDQLVRDSSREMMPSKSTHASDRVHVPSSKDKSSVLELRDLSILRNRNNALRSSASESRCECPARKNSSSPNLRLNQSSFPASHQCTETGRRRPKQVLSAEGCRTSRGMLERDSTSRKRKLSSQAISLDLKETTVASLALETHNRVAIDLVVSKPKHILSAILDTEDTKKASASFDDADKICIAENQPNKSSEVKDECAAGVSAVSESNKTIVPLAENNTRSEDNANYSPVHIAFPKIEADIDTTSTARIVESVQERTSSATSIPSTVQDSGVAGQFSTSLEQSESLPLDFDAESRSASTQPGNTVTRQLHDDAANSLAARSSDSAQLSPQPEFSFLWSDVFSGSTANTNVSWSALDVLFRDSPTLSLWAGPSTGANDAEIVAAAAERAAKGASVPDRPTSPETDDVRTPSPFGRAAKRTVSCPLSFDAESVCYETGDQEAFTPRQSSSNCWCCDKDERGLEHRQSSAHMPAEEYLRLKERLDQRPRTPALWEDSQSAESNLERDMDMATLNCAVAGFEQYSHVELFRHVNSLSPKSRAVDSLEQWLNEGVAEGCEMYTEERYGTLHTLSLVPSGKSHCDSVSIGSDRSEITIDDAWSRKPRTGEATPEEMNKLNEEAVNTGDATPESTSTFADCGEAEVLNISKKCPCPTETRNRICKPKGKESMADGGETPATTVNEELTLLPSVHPAEVPAVSYVNTSYSGMRLAEALDEYATGLSLKDVGLIPCKPTRTGVTPMPRLDDVDFSKFVPDDALSIHESLARMPKIVCKGTLTK